jgi:hypothetical protein
MNLYAIAAERYLPDKTIIKEHQYVVADSLCAALAWAVTTGTPIEMIVGITCACPVVAVVRGDPSASLPCLAACLAEANKEGGKPCHTP